MNPRTVPVLTNPRADRVRQVRKLAGGSARRRTGLFLAEGPSCAREGLAVGAVRDLYVTEDAADRYPDLADPPDPDVRVFRCTDEVLAELADTVTPQGVVAVCTLPSFSLEALDQPALVAVLAHVRDPGNAGTVIRVADAVGADAVVLTEASVDPWNPKCVRSTTGSIFHLPVITGVALADVLAAGRAWGATSYAADGAGTARLDDLAAPGGPLTGPVLWVFGNEARGLGEDVRLTDEQVRIPMRGRAESLNLAMAATICLYVTAAAQRPSPAAGTASGRIRPSAP